MYFNELAFNSEVEQISQVGDKFTKLLNEFARLDLFKIESSEDFDKLVSNPETFVKETIGKQLPPQTWGKFTLKKEAAIGMLDLPDFTVLKELAQDCRQYLGLRKYFNCNGNKLTRNDKAVEALKDSLSIFATTSEEVSIHEALTHAAKAMEALSQALTESTGQGIDSNESIRSYFDVSHDGSVHVSQTFFSHHWRNWRNRQAN